jgi:hypothetical protein
MLDLENADFLGCTFLCGLMHLQQLLLYYIRSERNASDRKSNIMLQVGKVL